MGKRPVGGAGGRSKDGMADSVPADSPVSSLSEARVEVVRRRLLDAALRCAGELGYANFAVRHVVTSAGTSRATFYTHFTDKADCFAQAHAAAAEDLAARIFAAAGAAPDWRQGVRAGLAELLDRVAAKPVLARAVLIDAQSAEAGERVHCAKLTNRIAVALDAARGETVPYRPAQAGTFVVGGIRDVVVARLLSGETGQLADLLPGLVQFALLPYFGEQIAWEELNAASVVAGGEGV
jgi:AcrR family transcriptional regulator